MPRLAEGGWGLTSAVGTFQLFGLHGEALKEGLRPRAPTSPITMTRGVYVYDDEDITDFVLRGLWAQVKKLAEGLSEPRYVYELVLDKMVSCLQHQQLPGKDVHALLCEVLRGVRDDLLRDALDRG